MKIAVVGSRGIIVSEDVLREHLSGADEIISGRAKGVDMCAATFAKQNNIRLTEFLPEYEKYGRAAPIIRNKKIVDNADMVIAFWDGSSKGTLSVIEYAKKAGKACHIITL